MTAGVSACRRPLYLRLWEVTRNERRIAKFAGTDDAILYSSCFDANGGLLRRC